MPDEENFDDDASQFTTSTINSMDRQDIDGDMQSQPTHDGPSSVPVPVSNLVQNSGPAPSEIMMLENQGISSLTSSSEPPEPPNDITIPSTTEPSIPKGKSIAHTLFEQKNVVFISLNMETGGQYCGILQLSAELTVSTCASDGSGSNLDSSGTNSYTMAA